MITEAVRLLAEAESPVFLIGNGCSRYAAEMIFDRCEIPCVASLPALGTFAMAGYIGHCGNPYHNRYLSDADVILAVGSRLDVRQIGTFKPGRKVISVNRDYHEMIDGYARDFITNPIHMDCEEFAEKFREVGIKIDHSEHTQHWWKNRTRPGHRLLMVMEQLIELPTVITTGVGLHQHLVAQFFCWDNPYLILNTSCGHGTMGYDLPATVGSAISLPDHHHYCIVGDGSIQMNIQELAMIQELKLKNIHIIILDNNRLGLVSKFQNSKWGNDPTCGDKYNPNFMAISEAYGIPAFELSDDTPDQEMANILGSAFSRRNSCVIYRGEYDIELNTGIDGEVM